MTEHKITTQKNIPHTVLPAKSFYGRMQTRLQLSTSIILIWKILNWMTYIKLYLGNKKSKN